MTVSQPAAQQPQPQPASTKKAPASPGGLTKPSLQSVAAIGAILIFVGFSAYLLSQASSASNTDWTRIAYVFGTIQALAAAAAGALWGSAVKQGQVNQADARAAQAETTADQNRDDANKGRALAATLQADAVPAARRAAGGLRAVDSEEGQPQPEDQTQLRHAELARSLFGNLVQPPTP